MNLAEPWQFEFMLVALAVTTVASVVCAVISCWLVLIGWSLMGDAVSHAVLPGVVLAYALDSPFSLGALVFGLLAVGLIGLVRSTSRVREDAAIGIVFTTLFALGLFLVAATPSDTDLGHIVFGNVLGVSNGELAQVAVIGALVLAVLLVKRRDLTLVAFDPAHAHTIGLSPARVSALLLVLLALTTVVALQAVGVILVVAMLVIPGATAQLLTRRFSTMLWVAPTIAAACGVVGLQISYAADAPPGALVVLAQGSAFFVVYVGSLLLRLRPGRRAPRGVRG